MEGFRNQTTGSTHNTEIHSKRQVSEMSSTQTMPWKAFQSEHRDVGHNRGQYVSGIGELRVMQRSRKLRLAGQTCTDSKRQSSKDPP